MSKEGIKGLIKAQYNADLVGEENSLRQFGVEIGQEVLNKDGTVLYEALQCISDYEFFISESKAIERAEEINKLNTNDWSKI